VTEPRVSDANPEFQITLVSRGTETTILCRASEFILQAALDAGIELPYSCLQGWCVTCAGRLLSGEVDQSSSLRFYPEDAKSRFALLCTARPLSDARIETDEKEAMRDHRVAHKLPVPLG
jgi:ferredoxin